MALWIRGTLLVMVLYSPVVFAINTVAEGYQVNNNGTVTIDAHSTCREVSNTSGTSQFVATKTSTEWTSFLSNLPTGLSAATCSGAGSCGAGAGSLTIAAVYPTNGAKWMDYVQYSNTSLDRYHQSDTACTGAETGGPANCIHGGEKLKVVVNGCATCTNLKMTDSLGAFNWTCQVDGGTTTFYSQGLKDGKGLRDLVNATSWKTNGVTLLEGGTNVATSNAATWWTNNVVAATIATAGQSLATSGNIYTVASSSTGSGFNVGAHKVALVMLSGVRYTVTTATAANKGCNTGTGAAVANSGTRCAFGVPSFNFGWLEGDFDLQGAYYGIILGTVKYMVLRNLKVSSGPSGQPNILISAGGSNRLYDVVSENNVGGTTQSAFGIKLTGTAQNFLHKISIGNMGQTGLQIESGASDNIVTELLATNNQLEGIGFWTGNKNTIAFATIAQNAANGIWLGQGSPAASSNTFNSILAVNNGTNGLFLDTGGASSNVAQFAAANNGTSGVQIGSGITGSVFSGNLVFGTNGAGGTTNCIVNNATAGMAQGNPSNCSGTSANLVTGISAATSFLGKAASDTANTSDTSGTATYALGMDWSNFDNFFRTWGVDGGTFPDATNRGRCTTSGTCRIWDWRLESTVSVVRNTSNNGSSANGAFSAGSACPAAVDGSKVLTDQLTTASTFLLNAIEVVGDSSGDDDGLCESNEACLYAPNFGAYQGEGDYLNNGTCTFTNGTVTGVTMHAYPTNGQ
jgi:hypothetical protein